MLYKAGRRGALNHSLLHRSLLLDELIVKALTVVGTDGVHVLHCQYHSWVVSISPSFLWTPGLLWRPLWMEQPLKAKGFPLWCFERLEDWNMDCTSALSGLAASPTLRKRTVRRQGPGQLEGVPKWEKEWFPRRRTLELKDINSQASKHTSGLSLKYIIQYYTSP